MTKHWTFNEVKEIVLNLDEPMNVLQAVLPERTDSAICKMRWRIRWNKPLSKRLKVLVDRVKQEIK